MRQINNIFTSQVHFDISNILLKKYLSEQKLLKEDTAEKLIDSLFGFQIYLIKDFNVRITREAIEALINGAGDNYGYVLVTRALAVCQTAVEYEKIIIDKNKDKEIQKVYETITYVPLLKKLSTDVISKYSSPNGIVLKTLDILKLHINHNEFLENLF